MKKISILFLIFLYLIPAVTFSVQTHYCQGKSILSFFNILHGTCTCWNKKLLKDCCKTKTITVDIKDTKHIPSQITNNFKLFEFQHNLFIAHKIIVPSFFAIKSLYYSHDPPNIFKASIFLFIRALRI